MTLNNFETYMSGKLPSNSRKFESRYPNETTEILKLLKKAYEIRKANPDLRQYNYRTIADYCRDVLDYKMVSHEGLRKIISRIAKDNSCEL